MPGSLSETPKIDGWHEASNWAASSYLAMKPEPMHNLFSLLGKRYDALSL
ncbi:hypothetical protein SAMN05892877_12017 [Rhizobium subbaraonis]|uniref:Uncharacterized protein n=1 Tax=Rhizobium subbaraonis TaxID=908946 RepID=A0A285UWF4_9HYPH|nr:hypothetical protein SAMN05892877_12017 [Rhizobium subbaraonis]